MIDDITHLLSKVAQMRTDDDLPELSDEALVAEVELMLLLSPDAAAARLRRVLFATRNMLAERIEARKMELERELRNLELGYLGRLFRWIGTALKK